MALLTNINGKFSVSDAGAVTFNNAFTFPTTDGTANYVLKTNGSGTVSWSPDSSPTVYWAANGNDIYNTNSANVGIGTSTPDAKLEVENNVNASFYSIFAKNPNGGSSAFVSKKWLNDDAAFGEIWRNSSTRSSSGQGALSFNMYNSADINFWSGGGHTMALVGSNVGIGTVTPSSFSGYTNLSLKAGSTGNNLDFFNSAGTRIGAIVTDGSDDVILEASGLSRNLIFKTDNAGTFSEKMRILGNGNVGIGTDSPANKLHIIANTPGIEYDTGAGVRVDNAASSPDVSIMMAVSSTNNIGIIQTLEPTVSWNTKDLAIQPRGGKVGIGTTSPLYPLNVAIPYAKTSTGTQQFAAIFTTNEAAASAPFGLRIGIIGAAAIANRYAALQTTDYGLADGGNIVMQAAGGNVGIGTVSPGSKLEVKAADTAATTDYATKVIKAVAPLVGGYTGTKIISLLGGYDGAIHAVDFGYGYNTTGYDIMLSTNDNTTGDPIERMRITSAGDVEVANSVTGGTFTVGRNGNNESILVESDANNTSEAYIRGYSTGAGSSTFYVWSNGNVQNINNSYTAISDIKLKENIVDATPKLDDLMKVKIKNYNLIGTDLKQIGVVAQELEDVFPNLIDEHQDKGKDENGKQIDLETTTKSVKYSVFVPILIKAIQELKAEIEILKNK